MWADEALARVIGMRPKHVLDVGCGEGQHAKAMREAGLTVTTVDLNPRYQPDIVGTIDDVGYIPIDCIWASHVLEHQTSPGVFLTHCHYLLRRVKPSYIAVTVPPAKPEIVGGHVTMWNLAALLYQLVLADFDCSRAQWATYGYNISVIAPRTDEPLPANLVHDYGDIATLAHLLPDGWNRHGVVGPDRSPGWQKKS